MKRLGFIAVIATAIALLPVKANAAPLDPLMARASFGMVAAGHINDVRFAVFSGRERSALFGDHEWICLNGDRTIVNARVSPPTRTTIREEACTAAAPSLPFATFGVDPVDFKTSISAAIRTQARKEISLWDPRNARWQLDTAHTFLSTTYVTLRWTATSMWTDTVVHAPICASLFFLCPSPVGAGLQRVARVSGAMELRALGVRLTFPSQGVRYEWRPSLAIWWDS